MSSNLEKRIRALEARLAPKYITLEMPDGKKRRILGNGSHLAALLSVACLQRWHRSMGQAIPASEHDAELRLIANSVGDDEAGGLVQMVRLALRASIGVTETDVDDG